MAKAATSAAKTVTKAAWTAGKELTKAAIEAGMSAYVVDGLRADRIKPILDAAIARFYMLQKMRLELAETRRALEERKAIDRAKGILMRARGITEEDAYALLRKIPTMPLVTGVIVVVFGGLTLWLHNDEFIKLKPTLTNILFAGVLLGLIRREAVEGDAERRIPL